MAAGRALLSSQNGLAAVAPLSSIGYRARGLASSLPLLRRRCPSAFASSSARCCSRPHSEGAGERVMKPEKEEAFVLTTPLYYVNAPPHMGSAYTTIAADAIARFQRLLGKKVVFITGTDEHGEKIAAAAQASGRSPREHCDTISQSYRILWREDEKELLENNCCPMHLKPCVRRKEDNYFFALSKYQKTLEDYLTSNPDFVKPLFRLNEVQGWIKSGLRDFSISRSSVEWGIPVPNDDKQTIYVWFDALLGYVSALLEEGEQTNLEQAVCSGWPASLHLIGKDILRFHAVYWPAMLLSAGLSVPNMVFGHGFLTKDGMKMGKSLGNTLEPKDLVQRFGADAVRYFFLREVEFGNDGDYSEDRFINIVNAHLANTIGNLLNRTLGLLKKNCQSMLAFDSIIAAEGNSFKDSVDQLVEKAKYHYENLSLSSACESVLDIANAGNLYMDERAPWSLFKQGGASSEMAAKDLVIILEVMRIIATALSPITPSLCSRIYSQLGFSKEQFEAATWDDTKWGGLKAGQIMAEPKPVFARIENIDDGNEVVQNKNKDKKKASRRQGLVEA
ncbi:methionine--tRNA ligase, chloroplastic/mitochondrial-like isoform X2 [Musa acuminata AAA Group]|uniref:methionine--tRNA ligase, chloroplastic/mitochondrial-like isoform X2 n=1 Tax=Musa acuminata AAA Group TaxID=214697 RepID=UPI0031D28991